MPHHSIPSRGGIAFKRPCAAPLGDRYCFSFSYTTRRHTSINSLLSFPCSRPPSCAPPFVPSPKIVVRLARLVYFSGPQRPQVTPQSIAIGSSFSCSTPRSASSNSLSMSMSSNVWTPARVTKAGGLGRGSNPLDSFFPFDPYLLRRSHVYIASLYNTWTVSICVSFFPGGFVRLFFLLFFAPFDAHVLAARSATLGRIPSVG